MREQLGARVDPQLPGRTVIVHSPDRCEQVGDVPAPVPQRLRRQRSAARLRRRGEHYFAPLHVWGAVFMKLSTEESSFPVIFLLIAAELRTSSGSRLR